MFDHDLDILKKHACRSFIFFAYKQAKASPSEPFFLKDILRFNNAEALKMKIKVEYDALIARNLWYLVYWHKYQDILRCKKTF